VNIFFKEYELMKYYRKTRMLGNLGNGQKRKILRGYLENVFGTFDTYRVWSCAMQQH
jgi:hypothetical protein